VLQISIPVMGHLGLWFGSGSKLSLKQI